MSTKVNRYEDNYITYFYLGEHFRERFIERIGEEVDYNKLIKAIQENRLPFMDCNQHRPKYLYRHKNKFYAIVYDKNKKQLATILKCDNSNPLYRILWRNYIKTRKSM